MASLGMPGLNNFVGEFLILFGTFRENPVFAVIGFSGLVFTLVYVLRLVQDSLFGEPRKEHLLHDVTSREAAVLVLLAGAVLFIGLHPGPILNLLQEPVQGLLEHATTVMVTQAM
jgi:NADH-quinone oxidoreductase subunit M